MEYFRFLPIVLAIISGFILLWEIPVISNNKCKKPIKNINLSIIIPAYNEEKRIVPLLESLKNQVYSPMEIIVVNDNSTDNTAKVCRNKGIKVIDSMDFEGNWIGKSRACWSGAIEAKGDTFLFLDADTYIIDEQGLERIVGEFENLGMSGVLSIQPFHMRSKLYENLSAVFNIILMAGMNVFTPLGNKFKTAGAFGPCLICSKEEYFHTGGHKKIKEAVLDDIELGKNYIKHELPVYLYSGKGIINFRMYPDGILQLFEGWSKNFGSGAKSTHPVILLMIILWVTGGFSSTIMLIECLLSFNLLNGIIAATVYIVYMLQMMWLAKKVGNFSIYTFLFFSIHHLFFTITFIWSFIQTNILRRVFWKGRKIKT